MLPTAAPSRTPIAGLATRARNIVDSGLCTRTAAVPDWLARLIADTLGVVLDVALDFLFGRLCHSERRERRGDKGGGLSCGVTPVLHRLYGTVTSYEPDTGRVEFSPTGHRQAATQRAASSGRAHDADAEGFRVRRRPETARAATERSRLRMPSG
ncbi:hypothetical protein ACWDU8_12960 [Streptomyces sp. NPDC003388]